MASREKGCEILKDRLAGIKNHLYWCVTSTKSGFEAMIKAKRLSIMRHITNRLSKHPSKILPNCIYGPLEERDYKKLVGILYIAVTEGNVEFLATHGVTILLKKFNPKDFNDSKLFALKMSKLLTICVS